MPDPTTANAIDITTLSSQQLSSLQARLSQELEHLTSSHQRLRSAQSRFRDCIRSIQEGVIAQKKGTNSHPSPTFSPYPYSANVDTHQGAALLVPLTTSLYVPGQLASNEKVIVDVGTGFYVEKSTKDAVKFYNGKVEELNKNLADIEKVVGSKNESLKFIEDGKSLHLGWTQRLFSCL
jgi:prefoldin alpha subunit